ncbi:MAG: 1,4-alpha-glucan branching protein GlgB [Bacteroidetes bacterium]|nr:1,4-alpha-glucan branching protein GlgB [Bacteroidota bacterium]MCY4204420.1 1,4-alpha-glucan branching protein GlgB [Bacteroidota bacterium]
MPSKSKTKKKRWLSDEDLYFWDQGTLVKSYERLGGHLQKNGAWFAVWAPHADEVSVIGDFNDWNHKENPLQKTGSGCWECFVPGASEGQRYKYHIQRGLYVADKCDPYAVQMEPPLSQGNSVQGLAAVLNPLQYEWSDQKWMDRRDGPGSLTKPISIYEVHLGSWRHKKCSTSLSYREIAPALADHVSNLGFTHVEFLPVAEHAYYGSWGYQVIGYFAPTYRYGAPEDLMFLIDTLHQRGIGVIIDWVPAHFATDPQGLVFYDGSTLFEYDDPEMRYHPDWGTYIFDYGKAGVRNFLTSNALFWIEKYHIDALRVDAVASMLYRDYSREKWSPNIYGERENLEAIDVIKKTNEAVYSHFPGVFTIAEESTAFQGVSAPTYDHGLGFMYKWNMGWMNDVLSYMSEDPVHRKYHHNLLTFSFVYAFSEHYILPLSHDEVVHGKGSLWDRMPGDEWQKAANYRLLLGHMYGHPGKKMLFMGSEFAQTHEWNHDYPLNWNLANHPLHGGITRLVQDLNALYKESAALWDDSPSGWSWVGEHVNDSILIYERKHGSDSILFALNMTPVPRHNFRIGVWEDGNWHERLNSDAPLYGGSGVGNMGRIEAKPVPCHGRPASLVVVLPPLAFLVLEKGS